MKGQCWINHGRNGCLWNHPSSVEVWICWLLDISFSFFSLRSVCQPDSSIGVLHIAYILLFECYWRFSFLTQTVWYCLCAHFVPFWPLRVLFKSLPESTEHTEHLNWARCDILGRMFSFSTSIVSLLHLNNTLHPWSLSHYYLNELNEELLWEIEPWNQQLTTHSMLFVCITPHQIP